MGLLFQHKCSILSYADKTLYLTDDASVKYRKLPDLFCKNTFFFPSQKRQVRFKLASSYSGRVLKHVYEDGQELDSPEEKYPHSFVHRKIPPSHLEMEQLCSFEDTHEDQQGEFLFWNTFWSVYKLLLMWKLYLNCAVQPPRQTCLMLFFPQRVFCFKGIFDVQCIHKNVKILKTLFFFFKQSSNAPNVYSFNMIGAV